LEAPIDDFSKLEFRESKGKNEIQKIIIMIINEKSIGAQLLLFHTFHRACKVACIL